jgi:hypothetical protein
MCVFEIRSHVLARPSPDIVDIETTITSVVILNITFVVTAGGGAEKT